MTTITQIDCCSLLGINPRTLHKWLRDANMQFATHPDDARRKCLTEAQVQQLAALHGRSLPPSATARPVLPDASPPLTTLQTHHQQLTEASPLADTRPCSPAVSEEADVGKRLANLEKSMVILQEQLAHLALDHLALELLRECQQSYEQRIVALEASVRQTNQANPATANRSPGRRLLPVELQMRSRKIPLIEYGAPGRYQLVCSQEGALSFAPDSAEWFDWLASLTSFHFVGPQGHFTAYREFKHRQRTRSWRAYRGFHGRNYKHYLGTTDHLTIARLEQVAAQLQTMVDAL